LAFSISGNSRGAIMFIDGLRREAENRIIWILAVLLANCVQDGQRRTIKSPAEASRDFALTAAAALRQTARMMENLQAFVLLDLRDIGAMLKLILSRFEKSLDTAEEKPHSSFAIGLDESPRRQSAPTPALNCFARDILTIG